MRRGIFRVDVIMWLTFAAFLAHHQLFGGTWDLAGAQMAQQSWQGPAIFAAGTALAMWLDRRFFASKPMLALFIGSLVVALGAMAAMRLVSA